MLDTFILHTEKPSGLEAASSRTLVVGYGNIDRQDDGVAWHVLNRLSKLCGDLPVFTSASEINPESSWGPALLFQLQLTPELVETFLQFDQIIFIDAQVGESTQGVQVKQVIPVYQSSPLTHHLTQEACMALLNSLYQHPANGQLVSIQGLQFGFGDELSSQTSQSADYAAEMIDNIMRNKMPTDEGMR